MTINSLRRLGELVQQNTLAPVEVATTENILLSGTQTIDGVSLSEGARVLVRAQDDLRANGVYIVRFGQWDRAPDLNQCTDLVTGTVVVATAGDTNIGVHQLFFTGTYNPGSTEVSVSSIDTCGDIYILQ